MTLHLTSNHLNAIFKHAEEIYPEECCGILLGRVVQASDSSVGDQTLSTEREVAEVWQTQNTWDESTEAEIETVVGDAANQSLTRSRRYWIDPRELMEAQRYGRDRQLDIIGIYHSHPDHPAMPSECDRVMAWQQYSYMIVSVQHGQAKHVLSWVLNEQNQFQPEEIHAVLPTLSSAASA
ncbi:MAG: M67 family metallopeptidase [Elainellaceae cyanobacterium]